jgi:hypothetical protein
MKSFSNIFKTLLVALVATTLTTSCIKDKFDEPVQLPDVDPNLEVNLTIEQLKDLYKTEPVEITEDYTISGVVISDDKDGNVYQTLIIQDATGGVGFRVLRTDLFTDYPYGRKVYVKLKGLWVGAYNNLIQVGSADDGAGSVEAIPAAFVGDFFIKGPRNQTVTPLEISIADLSSKYQNTLIKLKDVEFISSQAGIATYADAVKKLSASTNLEDCNGNKIEVRTSGYSKFAAEVVPAGKGDVVAIYQIFRTSNQLILNRTSDVMLTDTVRCGGPIDPPVDTIAPSVPGAGAISLFPGADFEDFTLFKAQISPLGGGLKPYGVSATGEGFGGGNALALRGTPTGNDYVFTINASAQATFPAAAKYVSFYVKGTSDKSLSINLTKADGNSINAFNVDVLTKNKLIKVTSSNQYTGAINTNGNWVLVTLDLTGVDLNKTASGTLFSIKVGKETAYDVLIDNIVVW